MLIGSLAAATLRRLAAGTPAGLGTPTELYSENSSSRNSTGPWEMASAITPTSGALLMALLHIRSDGDSDTDLDYITWGSSGRTQGTGTALSIAAQARYNRTSIFVAYLPNFAAGAGTLQWVFDAATQAVIDSYSLHIVEVTGAHATAPFGATISTESSNDNDAAPTVTVGTAGSTALWALAITQNAGTVVVDQEGTQEDQVVLYNGNTGGGAGNDTCYVAVYEEDCAVDDIVGFASWDSFKHHAWVGLEILAA